MENIKMVNKTNEVNGQKVLSVFCIDSVGVIDRTTFDSCSVGGVHVTFWSEEYEDAEERINRMFDALFNEVVKSSDSIRI